MKKGEKRRQDIIDTARELFYRKGYEFVSINDIMDALDATKGSFYHHFESKQDILVEIAKERVQTAFVAFEQDCRGKGYPEQLESLLYHMTPFRKGEEDFLAAILSLHKKQEGQMLYYALDSEKMRIFYPKLLEIVHALTENGYAYYSQESLPLLLFKSQLSCQELLLDEALLHLQMAEDVPKGCLKLLHALRFLWQRSLCLPLDTVVVIEIEELLHTLNVAYAKMQNYLPNNQLQVQTRFI